MKAKKARAFTLIELPFDKLRVVRQRGREAFTLIELLVVIAIIALLVTILMPSLQRAKELARRASCATNLHNIILAAHTYANDFRDLLPWRGLIEGNDPCLAYAFWVGDGRLAWQGYLTNYTVQKGCKMFYCPSMSLAPRTWWKLDQKNPLAAWPNDYYKADYGYETWWWGYDYYGWYCADPSKNPPTKSSIWVAPLPSPSRLSDDARSPVVVDLTRGFGGTSWCYYAHGKNGAADFYMSYPGVPETPAIMPEGLNSGQLDGSVRWFTYARGGGKIEWAVQSGGNPGFYQGKSR